MTDAAPRRPEPAPAPPAAARAAPGRCCSASCRRSRRSVGLYWYAMSGRYVSTENAYVKADIVAISPDVDGRVVAVEVAENQLVRAGRRAVPDRSGAVPHRARHGRGEDPGGAPRHRGLARRVPPDRGRDRRGAGARALLRAAGGAPARARRGAASGPGEPRRGRDGARGRAQRGWRCARRCAPCWPSSAATRRARSSCTRLPRGRGRARHGGARSRRRRGARADRRHRQPDAPAARRVGRGGRAGVQHHRSRDHLGSRPTSRRPSSSTSRSASRSRSRSTPIPSQVWQGEVASISPATGAEFALIPPQNATGNWVKVVQRLPVRIAVDRAEASRRCAPA